MDGPSMALHGGRFSMTAGLGIGAGLVSGLAPGAAQAQPPRPAKDDLERRILGAERAA